MTSQFNHREQNTQPLPKKWKWLKDELSRVFGNNDLDISDGCGVCGSLKIEWLCIMCDRHICSDCKDKHDPEHVTQPMLSLAMMGKCALHAYIEELHQKKMERLMALEEYRKANPDMAKKEGIKSALKKHSSEQVKAVHEFLMDEKRQVERKEGFHVTDKMIEQVKKGDYHCKKCCKC